MSLYENTSNELDRTTVVAIARDNSTKSTFIFNSSAGLREPTNEYKYLLEFFEITLCGQVCERLPELLLVLYCPRNFS